MAKRMIVSLCGCMCLGGLMTVEAENIATENSVNAMVQVDAIVENALAKFNVPGVAVGVVVDGKVILAKGYGVRNVEQNLPVTEDTLFPIGSCTKAFTALILGQLVEEGLVAWDDPIIKHIPEFRLKDPYATFHLTIRDALTHRSGLPRHDYLWYNSSLSRKEILGHLPYLEFSAGLREKFQYNNLMYVVAGLVIERITGRTYEEVVQERIFAPLAMTNSNFSVIDSQKSPNYSLPYLEKNDVIQAIPFRNISIEGPAGSINSSINDMVRWLQVQLSSEKTLVQPATLNEMHSIQIGDPSVRHFGYPEDLIYNFGYGFGWVLGTYKGHYYAWHNGGIDGFISNVSLLPQDKIGVIVLSNSSTDGHYIVNIICNSILDQLLHSGATDWVAKLGKKREEIKTALQNKKDEDGAGSKTPSARPIEEYAGNYEHPGYGLVQVVIEDDHLAVIYNGRKTLLRHHCYDNFKGKALDEVFEGESSFAFFNNLSGEIAELQIPYEPAVAPIVFKKKPSNALLAHDYLKQFEGSFEGLSLTVQIQLKGNQLTLAMPGQPSADLIPEKPLHFSVKGVQECTVRFEKGDNGSVPEVTVINSYGAFTFKRV